MLRISKLNSTGGTTLLLEGKLSGVWVEELRRLCETTLAEGQPLTIDCGSVSFSDLQGQELMRELLTRNVSLTNCSPFLAFQLNPESAG